MEIPKPATKHLLLPGSSSSCGATKATLSSSASSSSSGSGSDTTHHKKKQRNVLCNENGDHGPVSAAIVDENTSNNKNKQPFGCVAGLLKQIKDTFSKDLIGSSTNHGLETDIPSEAKKGSDPDAVDSSSNHSDEYDDYDYDEDDNEDYEFDTEMIANDYNYSLAAKFDDMDLPPGVEATVPWLQQTASEKPKPEVDVVLEEDIDAKFKSLKQFDTVDDWKDHHFANCHKDVKKTSKDWMKKIQQDWKILEKDLPETIYVRVYEERMDLLRAVIVGPAGTPYHDGLFFFDFHFPSNYPHSPPKAYYRSGGLRLNPNLYNCGKVCLSLLGTWSGRGCEKWDPEKSTMLQVLVSIQALVLNEKPYFNEPGYERSANTNHGERQSFNYNENTFLLSCTTMKYSLRNPPKHFEDFVAGHFRKHGHAILVACRAYLDGTQVGSEVAKAGKDAQEVVAHSIQFKAQLKQLFEDLLMEFTVKGADCKEFLSQKVKAGDATAIPSDN